MKIFFLFFSVVLFCSVPSFSASGPRISAAGARTRLPSSSIINNSIPAFRAGNPSSVRAPGSDLSDLGTAITPALQAASAPAGAEADSSNGRVIADLITGSRSVSEEAVWADAAAGPLASAPSGLSPAGSDSSKPKAGPESPKAGTNDSERPSKWSRVGDALAILTIVAGGIAGWAMIAYMFSQLGSVTFDPGGF